MEETWRLIYTPPQRGAVNMAIDEAIMEAVSNGSMPPTLRFYAWEPACLSLGYAQSVQDVDREGLAHYGWDLVRRITGGKAILHTDELTYSVVFPKHHGVVQGDILTSYRRISSALLQGLQGLALPVNALPMEKKQQLGAVCFEVPSNYEITVQGKKIMGSAQVRRANTVLQHGTLPLHGDITRICEALNFESEMARSEAKQRVSERATTVESVLGKAVLWQEVADTLANAFATTFEIHLEIMPLSDDEHRRVETFVETTYANPAWNQRF